MLISFIIPHKGREELLERTLQSVLDLDYDPQALEVIVVTQNAHLSCADREPYKGRFTTIFRPESDTISTLRNIGVQHASGEYLVFLDADIHLSPNWLTTMFQEMQERPERILVSAIQQNASDAGILEKIRVTLNNIPADQTIQFLDGRNLFLKRSTFDTVGGFPEHLVTCEDYYFTDKVHQQGELYFTSKATYVHLGEDKSAGEMFRKEIWRGQSNLQSLRGRKVALREIPSILVPLWEALFFVIMLAALLGGNISSGLLGGIMAGFPILLYALRLYRIGSGRFRFSESLRFYAIYFPARTIGTILGVFKAINIYTLTL